MERWRRASTSLQDKVNSLHADVEVDLRCEDEKWAETEAATKEIDSVEAMVARLQDTHDTVSEIDKHSRQVIS